MYTNGNWRHARSYGGNAWARIAELAIELADALRSENEMAATEIMAKLQTIRHNNGLLTEKLASLEKAIE